MKWRLFGVAKTADRSALAQLVVLAAVGLAACSRSGEQAQQTAPDWRAQVIDRAEANIRENLGDPSAAFSRVQVTGDDKTGQTCGFVATRPGPYAATKTARFIVYIDQTAGPYVEYDLGKQHMSHDDFERAWESDCLKEGYSA